VERTGHPKTRAHLAARAGGSSRRSGEANLATSLAGSRGRRIVHRRMSSRERRMVLLRMSCLASSARLDAMTRPPGCGTRTAARTWYLEPSCMLLVACMTVEFAALGATLPLARVSTKDRNPPGETIRGRSRPSTALTVSKLSLVALATAGPSLSARLAHMRRQHPPRGPPHRRNRSRRLRPGRGQASGLG
jgi:hypothetical protein